MMLASTSQLEPSMPPTLEEIGAWVVQRRPRVAVVDDSLTNRLVIGFLLEKMGCEVTAVEGGAAAIALIGGGAVLPDVIFMDVSMPDVDGLTATARIRSLPEPHGRIVIIGVSANSQPEGRQQCLNAGMNDFVIKPAGRAELLTALYRWV